jgi:hypothetical protein
MSTFGSLSYWQKQGLEKVIQTKAGNNLNQAILDNDQQALLRHFQDKGFRYVQVEVEKKDDKGNIAINFTIDLGREIEVAKVLFLGLPEHLFPKQLTPGPAQRRRLALPPGADDLRRGCGAPGGPGPRLARRQPVRHAHREHGLRAPARRAPSPWPAGGSRMANTTTRWWWSTNWCRASATTSAA